MSQIKTVDSDTGFAHGAGWTTIEGPVQVEQDGVHLAFSGVVAHPTTGLDFDAAEVVALPDAWCSGSGGHGVGGRGLFYWEHRRPAVGGGSDRMKAGVGFLYVYDGSGDEYNSGVWVQQIDKNLVPKDGDTFYLYLDSCPGVRLANAPV